MSLSIYYTLKACIIEPTQDLCLGIIHLFIGQLSRQNIWYQAVLVYWLQ